MKAALYGNLVGQSDFEINLKPPGTLACASLVINLWCSIAFSVQSTDVVEESLDNIMKVMRFD